MKPIYIFYTIIFVITFIILCKSLMNLHMELFRGGGMGHGGRGYGGRGSWFPYYYPYYYEPVYEINIPPYTSPYSQLYPPTYSPWYYPSSWF
jgi:hypothetical protein